MSLKVNEFPSMPMILFGKDFSSLSAILFAQRKHFLIPQVSARIALEQL
jgi:hypothetical protein